MLATIRFSPVTLLAILVAFLASPGTWALPNPASVHCTTKGKGRLDIRKTPQGEIGVCVFPDGSECEEWAYYYGKCKAGGSKKKPTRRGAPARP